MLISDSTIMMEESATLDGCLSWEDVVEFKVGGDPKGDLNASLPRNIMSKFPTTTANGIMENVYHCCYNGQRWSGNERVEASRNSSVETLQVSLLSNTLPDDDDEFISFPSYNFDGRRVENQCVSGPEFDRSIGNAVTALDDMEAKQHPTQHVDYLSHDWREEDLWASWRYIVSRRNVYSNSVRLENASWRTWAKMRADLQTVSPESIKWLKDCDVTWLYGPFQIGKIVPFDVDSRSNQLFPKFRHLDDTQVTDLETAEYLRVFAPKIASTDSISRQSSPSVVSQETNPRAALSKPKKFPFVSMSKRASPAPRKNVRFNPSVGQCIAVDRIHEEGEIDEDEISSQSSLPEWDSESNYMAIKPLYNSQRNESIRILLPTILNDGGANNPAMIEGARSWDPSRFSSYPIWLPTTSPNDPMQKPELISPKPFNSSITSYQIIEAYLDDPYTMGPMTDEEYFETEMFGNIQRTRPRLPALDEIEEMCSSSPSISECLSSESDDADDYDHPQAQYSALKSVADFRLEWRHSDDVDDEMNWWNNV